MPTEDRNALIDNLVLANHVLAQKGIVDGFGHVSARDPDDPNRFHISRSTAPALVAAADIMTLDLDGAPIGTDDRKPYLERFIHGEIYRSRPDVQAIVHSHTPSLIPFGIVSCTLRPVFHMAAAIGEDIPVFEIRDTGGDDTDMLVRDRPLGAALAATLGTASVVLMRGHGMTAVGGSVPEAVFAAVYADINARLQSEAIKLGPVTYLTAGEIKASAATNRKQISRTWELWREQAKH